MAEAAPAEAPEPAWLLAPPAAGRYRGPAAGDLTAAQRAVREEVLATRPGTGLRGPFGPWLGAPALAAAAQRLGRVCRYGTSLSRRRSELVILVTAEHWRSRTEFRLHEPEARAAGLSAAEVDALKRGRAPEFADPADRALHAFVRQLLATGGAGVPDAAYAAACQHLGEVAVVEAVGIAGYYSLVALTLGAFGVGEEDG